MMQEQTHEVRPVVKNAAKYDTLDTSSTWVKAINKLQRTGWRINSKILDAMLDNQKDFISYEEVKDNKPKELKRRSKVIAVSYTHLTLPTKA